MGIKKFLTLFLVCVIAMGALSLTAIADTGHNDDILWLEDMNRELIDVSRVDVLKESSMRATGSLNCDVPAKTLAVSDIKFPLEVGETVTINCSYSPVSANIPYANASVTGTISH